MTAALAVGQMVWSRGTNEYGDDRLGGMVVDIDADENGETFVLILTDSAAKPKRQCSLTLHNPNKKASDQRYRTLGLIARLERLALADVDLGAADDFRHYGRVANYARKALLAAALPPNDRIGSKGHDSLIRAYHVLRDEAIALDRASTTTKESA